MSPETKAAERCYDQAVLTPLRLAGLLRTSVLIVWIGGAIACGQLGFDPLPDSAAPADARVGDGGVDTVVDVPDGAVPDGAVPDATTPDATPDAEPIPDAGPTADAGRDTGGLCEFDTDCGRCERCMPDGSCRTENFTDLALGHQSTCAIGAGGSRWCSGRNVSGELGLPDLENHNLLTRNVDEEGWQVIDVGYSSSAGIGIRGGALWRWGVGADRRPTEFDATRTWTQVDIAQGRFCAIDDTDGLLCSVHMPSADTPWSAITVGYHGHLCGIALTGALFCWGPDDNGKLGLGLSVPMTFPEPQQVGVDLDWSDVAAGEEHTCALKTDGTLWCWGLVSRLGLDPAPADDGLPHQVGVDADWRELAVGWQFTCAVKMDGTLWCWGSNGHGQLATGDTSSRLAPTRVTVPSVLRVWTGGHHTCVQTSSDLECWGRNTEGELNQGDFMNRLTPTHICP